MTTAQIPVTELHEQSRAVQVRPGYAIATAIAWVFVAFGWLLGGAWRGLVFCAISARYGYWRGLGLTDEEIAVRMAKPEPEAKPGRLPVAPWPGGIVASSRRARARRPPPR